MSLSPSRFILTVNFEGKSVSGVVFLPLYFWSAVLCALLIRPCARASLNNFIDVASESGPPLNDVGIGKTNVN